MTSDVEVVSRTENTENWDGTQLLRLSDPSLKSQDTAQKRFAVALIRTMTPAMRRHDR